MSEALLERAIMLARDLHPKIVRLIEATFSEIEQGDISAFGAVIALTWVVDEVTSQWSESFRRDLIKALADDEAQPLN